MPSRPTVVFDLDGTLVNSLPDIIHSFQYAFSTLALEAPPEAEVRQEIGKPLEDMYARFVPEHLVPALCDAYRSHYPQHFTDHSEPYPGVLAALQSLRQRGYGLVVATTKRSDMAQRFMQALGLTPYLDHIQGTDDFPHKPAPDVILRALEAVAGQGLWMVGDTLHDMQAGKAAGLKTYAVTWGTHDEATLRQAQPDALHGSLEPLLDLLD